MRLFLVVVVGLSLPAAADCADSSAECPHGAVGVQGNCWDAKAFACKPCGKPKCPKVPTDGQAFDGAWLPSTSCPKLLAEKNRIDHCSGPDNAYKGLFIAACDQHDYCYHGREEQTCNEQLRENIVTTCNGYYVGALNEAQRQVCLGMSDIYFSAVEIGGHPGWVSDQEWAATNCESFLANADAMLGGTPQLVPAMTRTYVFKGLQYVRMTGRRVDEGYPKAIDEGWPGLRLALGEPDANGVKQPAASIDAAANFGKDYYFFAGKKFARWNIEKDKLETPNGSPLTGAPFKFKPPFSEHIDVALEWSNGLPPNPLLRVPPFSRVYFFNAAAGTYLRFSVSSMAVDTGYPKPIAKGWAGLKVGSAAALMGRAAVFVSEGTFSKWDVIDDDLVKGSPKRLVQDW